jgi:hypothetical protein
MELDAGQQDSRSWGRDGVEKSPAQDLLESIKGLDPEAALQAIASFRQQPVEVGKRGSADWLALQEVGYQEALLARQSGQLARGLKAVQDCDWREANELERDLVLGAMDVAGEVRKLKSGGYQVDVREGDFVLVARLSPELDLLMQARVARPAHLELEQTRDTGHPSALAQYMAKAAFHLHSAGQSDLALGLLTDALQRGLKHPALEPSRDALLGKGATPDTSAVTLRELYQEPGGWGRATGRVSPEAAEREMLRSIREDYTMITPTSEAGRWLLTAPLAQVETCVTPAVLAFLAERAPEKATHLLSLDQNAPSQDLLETYLLLGDFASALVAAKSAPLSMRWSLLTRLSQGEAISVNGHPATDPAYFKAAAIEAARGYAQKGEEPWRTQAAQWLLRHDPEALDWARHGVELPFEALLLGAELFPKQGLEWLEDALAQEHGKNAAGLWIELAHGSQRETLRETLVALFPRVMERCREDGGSYSLPRRLAAELVRAAGPWNDLPYLLELWIPHRETPFGRDIPRGLSEFPQGLNWAHDLSRSAGAEERLLGIRILANCATTDCRRRLGEMREQEQNKEILEELSQLLDHPTAEWPDSVAPLIAQVRPSLALGIHRASLDQGRTRAGGLPDLPDESAWPAGMRFLLQLDLAELAQEAALSELPRQGLLSFFAEDNFMSCATRVLHLTGPLRRVAPPPGIESSRPCWLTWFAMPSYPRPAYCPEEVEEDDWDFYLDQIRQDGSAVLGWSCPVQGGALEDRMEDRFEPLPPGETEWRLLLELDTHPDPPWMWMDTGKLHFMIPAGDLAVGRFDRVKMQTTSC